MGITKKIVAYVLSGFLFLTVNVSAQQSGNESQDTQQPQVQQNRDNTDTLAATPGVVVDSARTFSYQQIARDMTIKLLQKMNISFDQAADIEKILIDYQQDVADARGTANTTDQDRTGTDDNNQILGGRNEDLSEIDKEANSDIEDVLKDDQKNAYLFVKEDWWNELKSKVYGTENESDQNMKNEQNTDHNMNQQNENDQNMNNEQNTDQNTQGTDQHHEGQTGTDVSPDTGKSGQYNTAPADSSR